MREKEREHNITREKQEGELLRRILTLHETSKIEQQNGLIIRKERKPPNKEIIWKRVTKGRRER